MGGFSQTLRCCSALVVASSTCRSGSGCRISRFLFFPNHTSHFLSFSLSNNPSPRRRNNTSSSSSSSSSSNSFLNSTHPPPPPPPPIISSPDSPPFSGLEDVMMGYVFGKKKATQVAHSIWKHVIQEGDALVDATCGNGHDTLAMLKLLSAHHSLTGRVYAMDIQQTALHNTTSLLDHAQLNPDERKLVELFPTCHSRMEDVIPKDISVRLVAFNLGYLPGGDKTLITRSETTILGLEAAQRILAPGGLISLVVYVGHPGGMEEMERVEAFASGLPVDNWICCKLQTLNRPLAPMLVFIFKR